MDFCNVLEASVPPDRLEVLARLREEALARSRDAVEALAEIERELGEEKLPTLEEQADPLALDDGAACPDEERFAQVVRDIATLNGLAEAQAVVRARLTEIF